jgi:hypothetical protein
MSRWDFNAVATSGGRFVPVVTKLTQGGRRVDVSRVRDAPTLIASYSSGDPFGDSTAVLNFPALTLFDDLDAADLSKWLGYYSDVDIYWAPAVPAGNGRYPANERVIDALTNQAGLTVAPIRLRDANGQPTTMNAVKVWEGYIASMSPQADGLQVQCQGALFQLDRYLAKPLYPSRPWPLEALIAETFSHNQRPQLRTAPLRTEWPEGWGRIVPPYSAANADVYAPVATPGSKWTGYTSRQTGSWDHALTGFVQDQLSVMITRAGDGDQIATANQWTIAHRRASGSTPGREPILRVRDRFAAPDFSVWVGTPGLEVNLSGDSTQSENVIYGSGTDVHGTMWRNAVISNDGSRTDYLPLAASRDVYPFRNNPALMPGGFVSEAMTKFGTGFTQPDAIDVAKQSLARDVSPGWTGSITLATDPSTLLSRWQIRAGMVARLRGFMGSGYAGIAFHISAVTANPEAGTVELTVDTRFRDLLTVQEASERTRDPLTPVKMLQVNRQSVMIPDVQAPWDYTAGSGYIPKGSKAFHDYAPIAEAFPHEDWAIKHNPLHYGNWYVKCEAGSPTRDARWAGPVPVLTSEKGDILRTEVACYDQYGRILKIPFHVSIYRLPVGASAMPRDAGGPSAYIDNAFEKINPATGQEWPHNDGGSNYFEPADSFIIGWGNRQNGIYNRAGFSPGSESDGDKPTGLFVDGATWSYDNTGNREYKPQAPAGYKQSAASITLYAMFYAEHTESVYFMGRLYRANPGTD